MKWQDLVKKWKLEPRCSSHVGDGWVPMLDALLTSLSAIGFDVKQIEQIKEKCGSLRFYVRSGTAGQLDLIAKAEAMSATICEECGEPGHPRRGGWVKTLCDACAADRKRPTP